MYYRPVTAHVPLRPMGASPDGLGAYLQTIYTKPISPGPGGVFTVAYKPITKRSTQGLGCGCAAASGMGGEVYPVPDWLTPTVLKISLGVGVLGLAWFLLGRKKKQTANRRHRRNGKWSGKRKRSLPDSSFLYVEPGGQAIIEGGKKVTIPRTLRHFPYRDAAGNVDLPHLRNAIARIPQSNLSQSLKTTLQAKARSILAQHGGYRRARKAGLKAAA